MTEIDTARYWSKRLKPGTLLWGKLTQQYALVIHHEVTSFPSSWMQHRVCVLIDERIKHVDQEHGSFLNSWEIIDVNP